MKALFASTLILMGSLFGSVAFAFSEGTFHCKNTTEGLPDNVYTIESVQVGGKTVPHVDIRRFLPAKSDQAGSAYEEVRIQGFATVSSVGKTEIFSLAAVRLELMNGTLAGCRR